MIYYHPLYNELILQNLFLYIITFNDSTKFNVMLVCKEWLYGGRKVFDPSKNNNYALRWACNQGKIEVLKYLLQDERIDPSYGDNYAIQIASRNGYVEIVKLLLQDKRVDPSDLNNCAIRMACKKRRKHIVELLLKDPKVDSKFVKEYTKVWYIHKDGYVVLEFY